MQNAEPRQQRQNQEDAGGNDQSCVQKSRVGNSGGDGSSGRKREFHPSRDQQETPRSVAPRVSSAQCPADNMDGAYIENRPILQPAAASDVDLDSYLSFGDDTGMPVWLLAAHPQ